VLAALEEAKAYQGKPVFVHIRTLIGYGSKKAGNCSTHGAALGEDDTQSVHKFFGMPDDKFFVPQEVYDYYKPVIERGAEDEQKWNEMMKRYAQEHQDLHVELAQRLTGTLPEGWQSVFPSKADLPQAAQPTRKSSGIAVQALLPKFRHFTAGSADLMESTFVNFKGQVEFQSVSLFWHCPDTCSH
jgi:dihydroxyacetone synthase